MRKSSYELVFDRVFERVRQMERKLDRERRAAPALLARLAPHPLERQLILVRNSARFCTAGLCEVLLRQSWESRFDDPSRALEVAEVATAVAERLEMRDYGPVMVQDLQGRAWSHLGNARRLVSDLSGASEALEVAAKHLRDGSGGALERSFLLRMQAAVLRDYRRFDEAEVRVDQALALSRAEALEHEVGMALMAKSSLLGYRGDTEREIAYLQQAMSLIDPEREPRVKLIAIHNLAAALHKLERCREALALLVQWRFLYFQAGDRVFLVRLHWLEGQIGRDMGRFDLGEGALREAQRGFLELALPFEAAMVSLDLAVLYLQSGRAREVRELASEMMAFFHSRRIHREALAALRLFQEAVEQERATVGLVHEVSHLLDRAREDHEA